MNNFQDFNKEYLKLKIEHKLTLKLVILFDADIQEFIFEDVLKKTDISELRNFTSFESCINELLKKKFLPYDRSIKRYILKNLASENNFSLIYKSAEKYDFGSFGYFNTINWGKILADLYVSFYTNDYLKFKESYHILETEGEEYFEDFIELAYCLTEELVENDLSLVSKELKIQSLAHIACYGNVLHDDFEILDFIKQELITPSKTIDYSRLLGGFISKCLWLGRFSAVKDVLELYQSDVHQLQFDAIQLFIHGKKEESIPLFEQVLKIERKIRNKRTFFHANIVGVMHVISLLFSKKEGTTKKANTYIKQSKCDYIEYFKALDLILRGQNDKATHELYFDKRDPINKKYLAQLLTYWVKGEIRKNEITELSQGLDVIDSDKNKWLWFEIASVLHRAGGLPKKHKENHKAISLAENWVPIVDSYTIKEDWELALMALENSFQSLANKNTKQNKAKRLIWFFDSQNHNLRPVDQTINKSGKWSKGRRVALKNLAQGSKPEHALPEDVGIINAIDSLPSYWGSSEEYFINFNKACLHLVSHPNIFLENSPETRCDFILEKPQLIVEKNKEKLTVRIEPEIDEQGILIEEITPSRFRILQVDSSIFNIHTALNGNQLTLPLEGEERLARILQHVSTEIDVQSDAVNGAEAFEVIKSTNTPCVHLLPISEGFSLQLFIKPLVEEEIYLKSGEGRELLYATVDDKKVNIQRNLKVEEKNTQELIKNSSVLTDFSDGSGIWEINDLQLSLKLLLELQEQKDKVVIEWPKGEKLKIKAFIQPENVHLKVKKDRDWFNINGEVKVNDTVLMKLDELIHLNKNNRHGDFLELEDGEFLALTSQLRKKLDELDTFTSTEEKEIRLNPLTALLFQDLEEVIVNTETDKTWKDQKKTIEKVYKTSEEIPKTLQADLRIYQVTGYEWLCQLYAIGAGACLADDMGLGKTLQTIALLLAKGKEGPSLIIAPSSVVPNWETEMNRFAPILRVHNLNVLGKKLDVEKLTSFDVVISSYGLITSSKEIFKKVKWNIVSLDEAQAIKNSKTKRSEAVMELPAKFKMVTTGTPIENHLGELWNLFNFINPGLLGKKALFQEKYIAPIEKNNNNEVRQHLQKLIRPFVLRRRKSEVLQELPSKTEITLHVDLSEEEKAYYDAYRLKAIQDIESADEQVNGKTNNMKVLAEITRLRQLSCNVKLVEPDSKIQSSKLNLLLEVLSEALENNHRVLIFSQFVSHLALIKEQLEKLKVSYQYLDGRTPMKKRKQSVDAFQQGEGDVFLISLKAGGTGLNLTAADYVIHMDPWWNPAVEDQASDRVYRIGQKRPVTVYRLVSKDTIEEKIIKLHENKRDLAEGLLEGTDTAAKINMKELLSLMKG